MPGRVNSQREGPAAGAWWHSSKQPVLEGRSIACFRCIISFNPHGSVGWCYHHLPFTDEQTEAQRGNTTMPRHTALKITEIHTQFCPPPSCH